MMNLKAICLAAVSLLGAALGHAQQTINMETELYRLQHTAGLPAYVEGSAVRQISSYDREGGNNDGFEGTWSQLRKNPNGSLVIFEAPGKGVIERIWTPTPTDDTLDFYFDGAAAPSYSIRFRDLFSGKVFPFLNPVCGEKVGGWYSYLPIPFSNGCRIEFRGKKILFHQIQYRAYEGLQKVTTFRPDLSAPAKKKLEETVRTWSKAAPSLPDHFSGKAAVIEKKIRMKPGQAVTLASITGGGRLVGLELSPASLFEGLRNDFDIRITWDDENVPAVYAPVADFFGYAFGAVSMKSLLMGVDGGKAYSFMPMPFDKRAKVELVYRKDGAGQPEVPVTSRVSWVNQKRVPGKEGRFYAVWKRESPELGEPYTFLAGSGKGHYVGTLLLSQATSYEYFTEFFEGDDSTVLDGKDTLHGTGSEDYFNGGWYAQPGGWVERKGAPLHGCLDYSLPFSRTGGYRFYMSDKLPFGRSIYHSIEHGPVHNNRKVEYTSVAMYYADRPVAKGAAPTNSTARIFIPDTLSFYSRLMHHLSYEGDAKGEHGNATLGTGGTGAIKIDVRELEKGTYKVFLHGRGMQGLQYTVANGSRPGKLEGTAAGSRQGMSDHYIDTVRITDPGQPVRINLTGGGNKMELNRIFLVKQP